MKNFITFSFFLILLCNGSAADDCKNRLFSSQKVFIENAESVHGQVTKLLDKINKDWRNSTAARSEAYRQVSKSWREIKISLGAPEHLMDWSPKTLIDRGFSPFFMLDPTQTAELIKRFEILSDNLKKLGASKSLVESTRGLAKRLNDFNIYEKLLSSGDFEKLPNYLKIKYLRESQFINSRPIKASDYNSTVATRFEVHSTRELNLWFETVLENDFVSSASMSHSNVRTILIDDQIIGFEVTYSMRAKRASGGAKGTLTVNRYFDKDGVFIESKTLPEFVN